MVVRLFMVVSDGQLDDLKKRIRLVRLSKNSPLRKARSGSLLLNVNPEISLSCKWGKTVPKDYLYIDHGGVGSRGGEGDGVRRLRYPKIFKKDYRL